MDSEILIRLAIDECTKHQDRDSILMNEVLNHLVKAEYLLRYGDMSKSDNA